MLFVEGLQTEYDSETEDEVSDPEPQPEREEIAVRKENVDNHYILKEELGRYVSLFQSILQKKLFRFSSWTMTHFFLFVSLVQLV